MATFHLVFNTMVLDTIERANLKNAQRYFASRWKEFHLCIVAYDTPESIKEARAKSAELYEGSPEQAAFDANIAAVEADAELRGAAQRRNSISILFTQNVKAGTHGVSILRPDGVWIPVVEGVSREAARECMRTYKNPPDFKPYKIILSEIGVVQEFNEQRQIVRQTDRPTWAKKFMDEAAAQAFIDKYADKGFCLDKAMCWIVDFNYDSSWFKSEA